MRQPHSALNTLTLIAGLAAFLGMALLCGAVALTWDAQMTRYLLGAASVVAGVLAVGLVLLIGLPLAAALYHRLRPGPAQPPTFPQPAYPLPYHEDAPPALAPPVEGEWRAAGEESITLRALPAPAERNWT